MSADLPAIDYANNLRLIGHSDQAGRADGVQLMLNKGHIFTGHMFSKGFSVIDVRDPRAPRPVAYIEAPPNTWNIHLQTFGDLLLVINAKDMFAAPEFQDERNYYSGALGEKVVTTERDFTAGLSVYDIADPAHPRRIGFMSVAGGGIHRIWYTGGRWAYVSALLDGFTDYIFMTVDVSDPAHPREVGRVWLTRHEYRLGRNAGLGRRSPLWAAPRRRQRQHRLWRLARRRAGDDRRRRPRSILR